MEFINKTPTKGARGQTSQRGMDLLRQHPGLRLSPFKRDKVSRKGFLEKGFLHCQPLHEWSRLLHYRNYRTSWR